MILIYCAYPTVLLGIKERIMHSNALLKCTERAESRRTAV